MWLWALGALLGLKDAVRAEDFPLRISQDRRYLETAEGRPFLVVGDTAWSLIAQLREEEVVEYLDDRRARGFNAIIVNLIEHKFAERAPAKLDGEPPFLADGDFSRPNPRYFSYAHWVVEAAHLRGISVWLCPAYLGWDGGDEGFFREVKAAGPRVLRAYGRYVGERFRDLPNVVWMAGGDYALPESERWTGHELAAGIREGGASQLMTAHGGQTSAVATFGDASWLDIETVYSYRPDLWKEFRAAYRQVPVRPFVLIESTYEGEHGAPPERIRRQAWWGLLNGACGQFFGNNPIWYFDGPGFVHMRSAPSWREALGLAGSRDTSRLGRFFATLPWHELVPDLDGRLVVGGAGDDSAKAVAAHTADWRLAVVYIPADGSSRRELTLDLSRFEGGVAGRWFNPAAEGGEAPAVGSLSAGRMQKLLTPGDNGTGASDWVLVLESRQAGN
ncbi:MAG: DUF4038 domain-containing protein [Acidobacteriota bacterium]